MKKLQWLLLIVIGIFSSASLSQFEYPKYFPEPVYDFSKNKLQPDVIQLGRTLFYDPILSSNDSVSCASCHNPYSAFAHTDHALSHGIHDSIGKRNAPALFNLAWKNSFMHDGAIHHLDVQALAPISSSLEMNENIAHVVEKLKHSDRYVQLFKQAFRDSKITGEHLLKALAQFQLTLVSCTSRYDSMRQGLLVFSEQEQRGYRLFKVHCNSCHAEPLFTSSGFINTGLEPDSLRYDYGRVLVSKNPRDSFCFAIPSLRNISYTFPYMHDGRYSKLNQVLKFYGRKKEAHAQYDDRIKSIPEFSSDERVELNSFLLTLNDLSFVFRKEHQFPKEILLKEIKK